MTKTQIDALSKLEESAKPAKKKDATFTPNMLESPSIPPQYSRMVPPRPTLLKSLALFLSASLFFASSSHADPAGSYSHGGMPVSKARRATVGLKAGKGAHWEKAKIIQREKLSPLRITPGFPNDVPKDWRAIWVASSVKGDCFALVYPVHW